MRILFYGVLLGLVLFWIFSCADKTVRDCRNDYQCKMNEVCYVPMPDWSDNGYCRRVK